MEEYLNPSTSWHFVLKEVGFLTKVILHFCQIRKINSFKTESTQSSLLSGDITVVQHKVYI